MLKIIRHSSDARKGRGHDIAILALDITFSIFILFAFILNLGVIVDSMYIAQQNDTSTLIHTQDKYSKPVESTSTSSLIVTNKQQTIDYHDDPTIAGHSKTPSNLTQASSNSNELCTLNAISRRSFIKPYTTRLENILTCSGLNIKNFYNLINSTYSSSNSNLQQIEITQSDSDAVSGALEFICDQRFDCTRLTVLNVTGQRIDQLMVSQYLSSWNYLELLDLSNSSLNTIEFIFNLVPINLSRLTNLTLDNNNISEINFDYIFRKFPRLTHLSVTNNSIFNVTCSVNLRHRVKTQIETFSLGGNSINCEKSYFWLIEQISNAKTKFPEADRINCSVPERLTDMTWGQRVSVLETSTCDRCECRSLKRTAISVDCHNRNWTQLPDVLPINTKILNLTSNRINTLELSQDSRNWENVTYVYLENNLISSFQPLETNSKFMRNLAALDIRRNKFQEFPSHIFEQFINLDQVHLSNNPWLCDCEPTFAFQEWLQRQFHKVIDKEDIMCGISGSDENGVRSHRLRQRLSSKVIYRLSKSELCPQAHNLEEPFNWLDIVNVVLGLTIILVMTKVGLDYMYQHRTKRLPHFFRLNF